MDSSWKPGNHRNQDTGSEKTKSCYIVNDNPGVSASNKSTAAAAAAAKKSHAGIFYFLLLLVFNLEIITMSD